MMKRREFITLLGGAVAGWPLAARAQQSTMPVIGFLRSTAAAGSEPLVRAFRQGLNEAGFVEGQNVAVEYRWADDHNDRIPGMTAELVSRRAAVIVANGIAALGVDRFGGQAVGAPARTCSQNRDHRRARGCQRTGA